MIMLPALASSAVAYRAAYVEHHTVSPCGSGSCGTAQKRASVATYSSFIEEAAQQRVDIIVFPEYGITGFSSLSASAWRSGGYTETIPAPPAQRIVPCDQPNKHVYVLDMSRKMTLSSCS